MRDPDFGAGYFAHVMDWSDLDGDGDLDIVTATYDYLLAKEFGGFIPGGGVAYYENRNPGLLPALLVSGADALAVLVTDLDGDGQREIVVGNDYARPDYVFTRAARCADGLGADRAARRPTPTNTMSYAAGDVDNDGRFELFAADMKPYRDDAETRAAWGDLGTASPPDEVQVNANVLLAADADGGYRDRAAAAGVDATGWSWSAKFGDLDGDGSLDLYVVNGVITVEVFGHLPGDELVEENQALRRRRRRQLCADAGVESGQHAQRARHEHGGSGRRRRPGHRGEQPARRVAGVREPPVRRRRPPAARPAPAGHGQYPRARGRGGADHRRGRRAAPRGARAERLPVGRHPAACTSASPPATPPRRWRLPWPDGERSLIRDLAPASRVAVTRR